MSSLSFVPVIDESKLIDTVSRYIAQTLVFIQQHHPQWVNEKYRKTPWGKSDYQLALIDKLSKIFRKAHDRASLLLLATKYFNILFAPEFIDSVNYNKIIKKLNQLISPTVISQTHAIVSSLVSHQGNGFVNGNGFHFPGIAILLLDVENLQLDVETEKFLQGVCRYPIQIKVGFANWRSLGKKDAEFHERGYQLIHVPPGKDSADMKMAAVGASIFIHYPTAKEIFVCSSDQALTHLRNTLQVHGLNVYHVRKQREQITVLNSQTGDMIKYYPNGSPEMKTIEELIMELKELIKEEQQRTDCQWLKLARVATLYKEKYDITLTQVVTTYLPGSKASEIFTKHPNDFAVHKPADISQAYVTLFEINSYPKINESYSDLYENNETSLSLKKIFSLGDLESAIVEIVAMLTSSTSNNYVFLANVGSEFTRQYGQTITQLIKDFNLGSKFLEFLQSCRSLKVRKSAKGWQVALA